MTAPDVTAPDVTVVTAVHNAVPRLAACLDSLVGQTIGAGRAEVVAVDDGSTDGGGAVLDAYAARHPGLFRVLHQPRSGGPAAPANRGLDLARGRYVLFLGAGDRLGAEALDRMVTAADTWGSDVLVPRRAGADGRPVPWGCFHASAESVTFADPALAWALADTVLFRLDLLRRHGLRHDEELRAHADQALTLAACLHAERISVLADYDHHHPAPCDDRGDGRRDVTRRAGALDRLRGVAAVQQVASELAPRGGQLDAIRARHFGWEVPQLLQRDFLAHPVALQRRICDEVAALVVRFGAREVYRRLEVPARLRLELARRGRLTELCTLIRREAEHGTLPSAEELALPARLFVPPGSPLPPGLLRRVWRGAVRWKQAGGQGAGGRA